jgi:hypothetical protein
VLTSASAPLSSAKKNAAQQKSSSSARSHSANSTRAQLPAAPAAVAVQGNSCGLIETTTSAALTTASTSHTVVASNSLQGPQSINLRVAAAADEQLACGQVLAAFEVCLCKATYTTMPAKG